jgi:hypothetical protein
LFFDACAGGSAWADSSNATRFCSPRCRWEREEEREEEEEGKELLFLLLFIIGIVKQ